MENILLDKIVELAGELERVRAQCDSEIEKRENLEAAMERMERDHARIAALWAEDRASVNCSTFYLAEFLTATYESIKVFRKLTNCSHKEAVDIFKSATDWNGW